MSDQKQVEFKGTERFQIRKPLGSGGFGTVYEAYDKERNVNVALKVLHQRDGEALYRFKQEFRLLADIAHPNLITLYELMSDKEQWFFTMELIEGVDFLQYLKGKTPKKLNVGETETIKALSTDPSPVDSYELETLKTPKLFETPTFTGEIETIKLDGANQSFSKNTPIFLGSKPQFKLDLGLLYEALRQLAEGLYFLHKTGKLHCDIKPPNVLVTKGGRVVILDFGIATELTFQEKLQKNFDVLGTPAYMSPEQGAGLPLSETTDWYSVGVMLFEAITGKRPFIGDVTSLITNKQQFNAPSPSTYVVGIPADLEIFCQGLLKRMANERLSGVDVLKFLSKKDSEEDSKPFISLKRNLMPFVGRTEHIAMLKDALKVVKEQQRTATVYIQGRSGMGKSALVRYFLEEVRLVEKEAVILMGRCYEQESVPYKALDSLIDALSNYLKQMSRGEVKKLLSADTLALARLFPVLNQVSAITNLEREVLEIPDSQELRRRAFTALRELLTNLASKVPLILYIDDLQWGDLDSAVLLNELLRPQNPPPFLLITTYRLEDVNTSPLLASFLPLRVNADPKIEVKEITLKELSLEESQELAIALLGKNEQGLLAQVKTIAQESRGNPFFVDELVQYMQVSESVELQTIAPQNFSEKSVKEYKDNASINQVIEKAEQVDNLKQEDSGITRLDLVIYARVKRMPEDARRLLEVIAVAGQPIARTLAKQAAELDEQEQNAFALLRANRMIRISGTSQREIVETYHDRIRETIVAKLNAEKLKDYHYQLAINLATTGQVDSECLSNHFYKAGKNEQAFKYAVDAAEKAYVALAFEHAASLYQFALDLQTKEDSQTHNLQLKLAESIANIGQSYKAAKAYLVAAKTAKGVEVLKLHQSAAEEFLRGGFLKEGFAELNIVADKVGVKIPKTPLQAILLFLFLRLKIKLRGLDFKESINPLTKEELLRLDTFWTLSSSLSTFDATRGAVLQSQYILLALKAGELKSVLKAFTAEAGYAASAGGRKAAYAEKLLALARNLSERLGSPREIGMTSHVAGIVAGCLGQWKRSVEEFTHSEIIFRKHCAGTSVDIDRGYYWVFNSYIFMGELNQLFDRLPEVLKDINDRGNLIGEINLRLRTTYMKFLVDDEVEKAKEELDKTIERWSKKGFQMQHFWHLFGQVQSFLYAGDAKAAWQLLNEKWPTIKKTFFLRIQSFYIQILHLRARSAIALVAQDLSSPSFTSKLLKAAERDAKALEKENMLWGNAFAKQVQASVAELKGEREKAITLATLAKEYFEKADMFLYANAINRRKGQLMANSEGKMLIEKADIWMNNQQIKNPKAMANMLVPGKWPCL